MLRRKRVPGVARGPAWRLMGVIFGTMFFLMFTPTKWVHHFGLFAAVGRGDGRAGDGAGVAESAAVGA